jgi:glucosylceramidase
MKLIAKFFLPLILLAIFFESFSQPLLKTEWWLTNTDKSALLENQKALSPVAQNQSLPTILVDETELFQTMDGFGYALTGGSAILINAMTPKTRSALLNELFGNRENELAISYLRISIGASDLSDRVFTYNDLPAGETDPKMKKFSIDPEQKDLIPVLKEILKINPSIKIMGSPWTPPVWMKTNKNSKGGSLLPEFYDAYALYFVKYIQAMKAEGIRIDAITIQNEPLHPGNNPSLLMPAAEQAAFIKKSLGPAFRKAGLETKIIIYDHNANRIDYPLEILNDAEARQYVDGSAFHLYEGGIEALSKVHDAYPDKNLYFTEQWVGAPGNFAGDFNWHVQNLIIGASRNWCKTVIEWNLAADPKQDPHTEGGCTACLGAVTIDENQVTRNPAYYIIGVASKFVPTGSVRIESNLLENLPNVAFKTPEGKIVVILLNSGKTEQSFQLKLKGKYFEASLKSGSVATFVL